MGQPIFLVENLFSTAQFSQHTVQANEEPTGTEAWRVATGRRSGLDMWTPTTLNADAYLEVQCDRVRGFDMIALDRDHNLEGVTVQLRGSNQSAFTAYETILSITLPSTSAPASITDALGVVTEEGAWVKRFDFRAYRYVRFFVGAMGAGLKPEIVGLWLGLSYRPRPFDFPWTDEADEIVTDEDPVTNVRRVGTQGIRLETDAEYELARYHLQSHFGYRRPTWLCPDETRGDRTMLVRRAPASPLRFEYDGQWLWRRGVLQWVEHEPLEVV